MIDLTTLEGSEYNYAVIQEEFRAVIKPFYERLKESCIITPFTGYKNPPPENVRDQYSTFLSICHVNIKLFPLKEGWFKLLEVDKELNKKFFVDTCKTVEFQHVFKEFEKDVSDFFDQYQPIEFSEINRGVVWATQDKNPECPLQRRDKDCQYFEIALSVSYSSMVRLPPPSLLAVKMEERDAANQPRDGWRSAYAIKKMEVAAVIAPDLTIKVDSCQCLK